MIEYIKEFNELFILGIVPLAGIWFGYKSLKLKVADHNRQKREKHNQTLREQRYEDLDWDNAGDDTIIEYAVKKIKERKK